MPQLWAGVLLPVVLYCLGRTVLPATLLPPRPCTRPGGHGRDVDAGHVLMGGAMLAMLGGRLPTPLAFGVLVLSATAVAWSAALLARRTSVAAHVRLGLGALAMVAMTLPLASPAQAAAPGMAAMSGGGVGVPAMLLSAALGVVAASRLPSVVRRRNGPADRLDAGCDVVMAAAMAAMLLALT